MLQCIVDEIFQFESFLLHANYVTTNPGQFFRFQNVMLARQIHVKITEFVVGLERSLCANVGMVFKGKRAQVINNNFEDGLFNLQ
jgi:hypothetical protein